MCVIIVKPANVAMPCDDILTAAAIANHDGYGFVSPTANYKGLDF